jgi:hypothetical protein
MVKIQKYILKCDNCGTKVDEDDAVGWISVECEMGFNRQNNGTGVSFRPGTSFCKRECAIEYFARKLDELMNQTE